MMLQNLPLINLHQEGQRTYLFGEDTFNPLGALSVVPNHNILSNSKLPGSGVLITHDVTLDQLASCEPVSLCWGKAGRTECIAGIEETGCMELCWSWHVVWNDM